MHRSFFYYHNRLRSITTTNRTRRSGTLFQGLGSSSSSSRSSCRIVPLPCAASVSTTTTNTNTNTITTRTKTTIVEKATSSGSASMKLNNKASMTKKKKTESNNGGRPTDWKAKTEGYEKYVYYVGKHSAVDFIETNREMCDYIRSTYGSEAFVSMLKNKIVIEDREKPTHYATKAEMEKALSYTEQLVWFENLKAYHNKKHEVKDALSKIAALLYNHCHVSMRYKLAADKDYQQMSQKDGGEMYRLISKLSLNHGSNTARTKKTPTTPTPPITSALSSIRSDNDDETDGYGDGDKDQPSSPPPQQQQPQKHLTLAEVDTLCRQALSTSGLNAVATDAITTVVTAAERDGCHSHGLFRVPGYCQALLSGRVDGTVQPSVHYLAPGVVKVDAGGGYAPPALIAGRDLAIQKARTNGISCLVIQNSVHYAALWWEVEYFANQGIVSLAFVNSRSFVAHQPGGTRKLYGTNPMAFGFPRAAAATATGATTDATATGNNRIPVGRQPLVWDQASAAMARGEIQLCHRDGRPLPEGVALDQKGAPTTSPAAALEGAQLPFGGHKGSAIAMMVELLAAGLTGSHLSFEADDDNDDDDDDNDDDNDDKNGPTQHGELIILIDPLVTTGGDDYLRHCELLFAQILQEDGTRLPSTRRYANRLKTVSEGITIPQVLYKEIVELGGE